MHTEYLATNLLEIPDKITLHGIATIDQFLPASAIAALAEEISQLAQLNTLKAAGTGREKVAINANLRGDYIYWLDEQSASPAQQVYLNTMESLRLTLNRRLYLGIMGLESHLTLYPPGMAYQKHIDRFKGETHSQPLRQISAVLYLNSAWQESNGGHLRLYLEERPACSTPYVDILPTAGKAVFFLSDTFYHEVLPANQVRMSLTAWFLTR